MPRELGCVAISVSAVIGQPSARVPMVTTGAGSASGGASNLSCLRVGEQSLLAYRMLVRGLGVPADPRSGSAPGVPPSSRCGRAPAFRSAGIAGSVLSLLSVARTRSSRRTSSTTSGMPVAMMIWLMLSPTLASRPPLVSTPSALFQNDRFASTTVKNPCWASTASRAKVHEIVETRFRLTAEVLAGLGESSASRPATGQRCEPSRAPTTATPSTRTLRPRPSRPRGSRGPRGEELSPGRSGAQRSWIDAALFKIV